MIFVIWRDEKRRKFNIRIEEHIIRDEGGAGSNPATPTVRIPVNSVLFHRDRCAAFRTGTSACGAR
jgi:hypothetical protein